jgi:hypothetical protein
MSAPLTYQIDLINGVSIIGSVANQLLKDCTDDEPQPLVFPPLELFGQWLMADGQRIEQGSDALTAQKPVRFRIPITASPASMAKPVANNVYLTSAFLFASCCTIGFDTQKSGRLIHEMMNMKGYISKYPISSRLVCEFVEIFNGYRDFIQGYSPFDMYDSIAEGAWAQNSKQSLRIDNFYDDCDIKVLANLITTVLDALQDMDNTQIYLEGSKTGIMIASIFAWLRPDETEVIVNDFRIHPLEEEGLEIKSQQSQSAKVESERRLLIRFRSSPDPLDDKWSVSYRKGVDCPTETFHIGDENDMIHAKRHQSLWSDAKRQVEVLENTAVSRDIGHLAAALVNVVTEYGTLWSDDGKASVTLNDVCSEPFLYGYNSIMDEFGWCDLSHERVAGMAHVIRSHLENGY